VTVTEKSMLRFTATGSVDDGKSTLIGRLLYETKSIYEDQYEAIKKTSKKKGFQSVDLALLLDGLSAEREQGITIDVAHRYFETPTRKYIIADTPGHVQYTRNMVTGASTADCTIILIDARNGVLTQSKRHGFIASLLQIPHMIVAINKMDLVDYSEEIYSRIEQDYQKFSEKLDIHDIVFIPVSALRGDNVVEKSKKMPWYKGSTLLYHLEHVHPSADRNLVDFRFPVQYVIRPQSEFRGYAGKIVSGTIKPGEQVVVLPSGTPTSIRSVITYDQELEEAYAPQSIVLTLTDEIDVSRGDMIVRKNNLPQIAKHVEAIICWMDEAPSSTCKSYILKHTTRQVRVSLWNILYRINVDTLHREQVEKLTLNDIGRVKIRALSPLCFDVYKMNHGTGSFILIDPESNHTVAAGLIRDVTRNADDIGAGDGRAAGSKQEKSPHTVWSGWNIPRDRREQRNGHQAAILWFTGYSGSGKSTIARQLEMKLFDQGCQTMILDGDQLRHGLCRDLGFSDEDRSENIRRIGEVSRLFFESGKIVICTFISPFADDRAFVRELFPEGRFWEIYVKCELAVCRSRDPHDLYRMAEAGEIKNFTGISSAYEAPKAPEMTVETDKCEPEDIVGTIILKLKEHQIIPSC